MSLITNEPVERNEVENFLDDLRFLAEWREANQDDWGAVLFPSDCYSRFSIHAMDASTAADAVRRIGGKWDKKTDFKGQYMVFTGKLGTCKVDVWVSREQVCTPVVVGKKTIKRPETTYIDVEVDDVEYECGSLMSAAAKLDLAKLEALAS
ncbi:hypothetical protein [Subtercola vilae]|uniref:Uncharacterized protein n=1 Tax=Subtercola vilae TaxID=2056433 RepID=A0A4T2BQ70_9MICO|nr:hypothetical protein [Subtercola vilae]TIH33823.1 hypothetical protein D4765_13675 [Subtercola vilae]